MKVKLWYAFDLEALGFDLEGSYLDLAIMAFTTSLNIKPVETHQAINSNISTFLGFDEVFNVTPYPEIVFIKQCYVVQCILVKFLGY